jgi:hypothetical protein
MHVQHEELRSYKGKPLFRRILECPWTPVHLGGRCRPPPKPSGISFQTTPLLLEQGMYGSSRSHKCLLFLTAIRASRFSVCTKCVSSGAVDARKADELQGEAHTFSIFKVLSEAGSVVGTTTVGLAVAMLVNSAIRSFLGTIGSRIGSWVRNRGVVVCEAILLFENYRPRGVSNASLVGLKWSRWGVTLHLKVSQSVCGLVQSTPVLF